MKSFFHIFFLLFIGMSLVLPVRAVNINVTYHSSVLAFPSIASNIQTAIGVVTNAFHVLFTNNSTVNITCYWGAVGPFSNGLSLGGSFTRSLSNYTYVQLTNALHNLRTSSNDSNAVASLPATDPIAKNSWFVPRAEAKALGMNTLSNGATAFTSAMDLVNDGAVGFSDQVSYTFDPAKRTMANRYDFIGVAEHEITEVMGRNFALNYLGVGYYPNDLFRFTNSGARNFSYLATNVYFSVDNGTNRLKMYYPIVTNGDLQDWSPGTMPDAFDESSISGTIYTLSPEDVTAMDVLGYKVAVFPQPQLTGARLTNGTFRISFTNVASGIFSIYAATNLTQHFTNWVYLGPVIENPTGTFQFVDGVTPANKLRFYRVRSP